MTSLHVLFPDKPYFAAGSLQEFTVMEGQTKNMTLHASANPPQIHYSWTFPNRRPLTAFEGSHFHPRISTNDNVMTVARAQRADAGNYTVSAWNSHGDFNSSIVVRLRVLYPPR